MVRRSPSPTNSHSAASAVGIDAFHDLEIGQCATRLRLLVAAGFAGTLLSASLVLISSPALDWWGGIGNYERAMG
jgi:hypothetical protein